jgi:hypothetical protein
MSLIDSARIMVTLGFMSLPLLLIAYTFLLGFGLGNIGMIILFFGQISVVPIAAFLLQNVLAAIQNSFR